MSASFCSIRAAPSASDRWVISITALWARSSISLAHNSQSGSLPPSARTTRSRLRRWDHSTKIRATYPRAHARTYVARYAFVMCPWVARCDRGLVSVAQRGAREPPSCGCPLRFWDGRRFRRGRQSPPGPARAFPSPEARRQGHEERARAAAVGSARVLRERRIPEGRARKRGTTTEPSRCQRCHRCRGVSTLPGRLENSPALPVSGGSLVVLLPR